MNTSTAIALPLALASTVLINFAYLREHEAVAALPVLSMRRPLQSARALLTDRSWLLGFAMESCGFINYIKEVKEGDRPHGKRRKRRGVGGSPTGVSHRVSGVASCFPSSA